MKNLRLASLLAACLMAAACVSTSDDRVIKEGLASEYALVLCSKEDNTLVAYTNVSHTPRRLENHAICVETDKSYRTGEVAGYLTSGSYFRGLKGEFILVCTSGFIAMMGTIKHEPLCVDDPSLRV